MGHEFIDAAALSSILGSQPGLLLGPDFSLRPGFAGELNAHLAERFDVPQQHDWFRTIGGVDASNRLPAVRDFIDGIPRSPQVTRLGSIRWSAVASLCHDTGAVDALNNAYGSRPGPIKLASLKPADVPPPASVPFYNLVGLASEPDPAVDLAGLSLIKTAWAHALSTLLIAGQGSPIVALGLGSYPDLALELVAGLLSAPTHYRRCIVLLASDPLANNSDFLALGERAALYFFNGDTRSLLAGLKPIHNNLQLSFSDISHRTNDPYAKFADVTALVEPTSARSNDETRLLDILFAPHFPNWEPFDAKLDFERDQTQTIATAIAGLKPDGRRPPITALLTGPTGVGKTTMLRRVAYDLAVAGERVLWMKQCAHADARTQVYELARQISRWDSAERQYIFVDDPYRLGNYSFTNLLDALEQAEARSVVMVVGCRASDFETDRERMFEILRCREILPIDETLTAGELERLPGYLSRIGAAPSGEIASRLVAEAESETAGEIFGTLYFLLPQTRALLEEGLRDEYFRLGDSAAIAGFVQKTFESRTPVVRDAYAMVAVADSYGFSVPTEVLVSALGIDYRQWISAVQDADGRPFGLLHPEDELNLETSVSYRTRNSTVTRTIVNVVNGGRMSHQGEHHYLEQLLRGCRGSDSVYSGFATALTLAVERSENFDFQDGVALFDAAIDALPHDNPVLLHHRAIWHRKFGKLDDALSGIEQALEAENPPYASQQETPEHLQTSKAATLLQKLKDDPEDSALTKSLERTLLRTKSTRFLNTHGVHVQCQFALLLLERGTAADGPVDVLSTVESALNDAAVIVQTLEAVRASKRYSAVLTAERVAESLQILGTEQIRLFTALTRGGDIEAEANKVWKENYSQIGFIVNGRRLLHEAERTQKNSDFATAFAYVEGQVDRVNAAGRAVDGRLWQLAAESYYKWRIAGYDPEDRTTRPIDWGRFSSFATQAAEAVEGLARATMQYFTALALIHQNKWDDAEYIFRKLRESDLAPDIKFTYRDLVLDSGGQPHLRQGEVSQAGRTRYFRVDGLGRTFRALSNPSWRSIGEKDYAYIAVCFAGTACTKSQHF